jgi:hypothetical protein
MQEEKDNYRWTKKGPETKNNNNHLLFLILSLGGNQCSDFAEESSSGAGNKASLGIKMTIIIFD